MKRFFLLGALTILLFSITACSNRAIYENAQRDQQAQCVKVEPARYEQCMRDAGHMPYDEYERERQELLEEDK